MAISSGGCPGPAFVESGPATRPAAGEVRAGDAGHFEAVAFGPPSLRADPPDVLAGRAVAMTVRAHLARPQGGYRLELGPEVGRPVVLDYELGGALRLPVEAGELVEVRLPLDGRGDPRGLVIREPSGPLRALVSTGVDGRDPLVEATALPIAPDFSAGGLVYAEARADRTCLVEVDHHGLLVGDGRDRLTILPGTSRRLYLTEEGTTSRLSALSDEVGRPFALHFFDASRAGGRTARALSEAAALDETCPRPWHISWALLAER